MRGGGNILYWSPRLWFSQRLRQRLFGRFWVYERLGGVVALSLAGSSGRIYREGDFAHTIILVLRTTICIVLCIWRGKRGEFCLWELFFIIRLLRRHSGWRFESWAPVGRMNYGTWKLYISRCATKTILEDLVVLYIRIRMWDLAAADEERELGSEAAGKAYSTTYIRYGGLSVYYLGTWSQLS